MKKILLSIIISVLFVPVCLAYDDVEYFSGEASVTDLHSLPIHGSTDWILTGQGFEIEHTGTLKEIGIHMQQVSSPAYPYYSTDEITLSTKDEEVIQSWTVCKTGSSSSCASGNEFIYDDTWVNLELDDELLVHEGEQFILAWYGQSTATVRQFSPTIVEDDYEGFTSQVCESAFEDCEDTTNGDILISWTVEDYPYQNIIGGLYLEVDDYFKNNYNDPPIGKYEIEYLCTADGEIWLQSLDSTDTQYFYYDSCSPDDLYEGMGVLTMNLVGDTESDFGVRFYDGSPSTTENLFVDGDMEETGTTEWTSSNATLSKSTLLEYGGSQNLTVYGTDIGGYAEQDILEVDEEYLLLGVARSDGTAIPVIKNGTTVLWTASSAMDYNYMHINEIFTATDTTIRLMTENSQTTTYDDLVIIPVNDYVESFDNIRTRLNFTITHDDWGVSEYGLSGISTYDTDDDFDPLEANFCEKANWYGTDLAHTAPDVSLTTLANPLNFLKYTDNLITSLVRTPIMGDLVLINCFIIDNMLVPIKEYIDTPYEFPSIPFSFEVFGTEHSFDIDYQEVKDSFISDLESKDGYSSFKEFATAILFITIIFNILVSLTGNEGGDGNFPSGGGNSKGDSRGKSLGKNSAGFTVRKIRKYK